MFTSAEMVEKVLNNEQEPLGMLGWQIWEVCLEFACRAVVCDGY